MELEEVEEWVWEERGSVKLDELWLVKGEVEI